MYLVLRYKNLNFLNTFDICVIILHAYKLTAGGQGEKNKKAERESPQDFMQTLIPQIGSNLVFRLPLL